ncbi:hypothetical protein CSIM01_10178 [Colletotrichum simmondsii]|uniref:Integral membrane protein n=1 Tax=Colletotrichum simmondsii TaxID=703756 RepID=A0A135SHQ4_9PEZI|nr:hypothetical protein CSIM01_10178 [Colletotrichum simmondsii]
MNGLSPEYVNASNAGRIVGVVGAFHFIALAFVSLRVYARVVILRAFGTEDALIVAAAHDLDPRPCLLGLPGPSNTLRSRSSWLDNPDKRQNQIRTDILLEDGFIRWRRDGTVEDIDGNKFASTKKGSTMVSMVALRGNWYYEYEVVASDPRLPWLKSVGFVIAYSIQAIAWLFVYCTPYSGWWEFQWMNPFDSRCHDFNLFINLTYWNICILNLGYFAVIMGILKAVFMLTTGGSPDAIFDYWVHFWQNLQLNIGIIAACASYLKPLFGRFLRINSSVDYYPSNERYGRSGQTPLGAGASRNTPYASGNRRTSRIPLDRSLHDEFEMHTKDEFSVTERYISGTGTRDEVVRSPIAMEGRCSAEAVYAGALPSDTNSEEIILQKEHGRGIVCTRDFSVKYSENDTWHFFFWELT